MEMEKRKRLRSALDSLVCRDPSQDGQLVPGKGQPWDRNDLLHRLQSFRSSTWFAKPEGITPSECARHGWLNTGLDTLGCECCGSQLYCPIPPDAGVEDTAALGVRFGERLASAHADSCPWRAESSPASLLQLRVLPADMLAEEVRDRLQTLERCACLPPPTGEVVRETRANDPAWVAASRALRPHDAAFDLGAACDAPDAAAVRGSAGFAARAALLALLGWRARDVAAALAPRGQARSAGGAQIVVPERGVLSCGKCGADVPLWSLFPGVTPQYASTVAAVGRVATQLTRASLPVSSSARQTTRPPALSIPSFCPAVLRSPGSAGGTTIAGGPMRDSPSLTPGGPFGRSLADAAPVFGVPVRANPMRDAVAGSGQGRGEHCAPSRPQEDAPGSSAPTSLATSSSEATLASQARPCTDAAPQYLSAAALQRYAEQRCLAFDLLTGHRAFCPWLGPAADGSGRPGWLAVLQELAGQGVGPEHGASAKPRDKAWDPAHMLRSIVGKVSGGA